jgi:peptidoglycan/xylan/chitin deacetylase (PgdA/CDA1 family)
MNATAATGTAKSVGSPHTAAVAKGAAKQCVKRAVASAGSGLNSWLGSRAKGRAGILMYHRVVDPLAGVAPPTWNVTPGALRAQLSGLLARGFTAWPLGQLIEAHARGTSLPPNTFAVTFDDGHESVYRHAWPILKELRVPATLFLPTAYIDDERAFPFDGWAGAGSDAAPREMWQPMTTAQCRAIAADGLVELGAHTHTHQDFTNRPDEFDRDLALNVEVLESQFGGRNLSFAFPFGRATPQMMDIVRNQGLSCGLVTADLLVDPRQSPFGWGRFHVETWDTAATLAAKLSGWYSWAPNFRRRIAGAARQP